MYFEEDVQTNHHQPPRNNDGGEVAVDDRLSIFRHPGRPTRCIRNLYFMSEDESNIAHLYALKNTPEVTPFLDLVFFVILI
ncbi:hypothetical protein LIER_37395 [Lithospermum erythrorhizon]|uniref:Uncharacterized protein n=1 Tax=Lithospermum erythrorhizon TaxID=34254 RepID=A0AAV3PL33_LITER